MEEGSVTPSPHRVDPHSPSLRRELHSAIASHQEEVKMCWRAVWDPRGWVLRGTVAPSCPLCGAGCHATRTPRQPHGERPMWGA